jgi:hypothetical protein
MAIKEKSTTVFQKEHEPCPLSPEEIVYDSSGVGQSDMNTKLNDRFRIIITLPSCIPNVTELSEFSDSDRIIFSAVTVSSPKISIPSIPINYIGKSLKISSNQREPYEDIAVTYKVDSKFQTYAILYNWLNFLADEKKAVYNGEGGSRSEYTTNIEVQILDEFRNDLVVASWKYNGAFITSLDSIEFSFVGDSSDIQGSFSFAFTEVLFELTEFQG